MLLATGLPTQDLYNAQIDIRVAVAIPARPETEQTCVLVVTVLPPIMRAP
jgi:hypothetical protein